MKAVIFEDQYVRDNLPAALVKPAFAVTCGVDNLYSIAKLLGLEISTLIREYLVDTASRKFPSADFAGGPTLFMNAALVPDINEIRKLLSWAGEGKPFLVSSGHRVAAAFLPECPPEAIEAGTDGIAPLLLEQKPPLRDESLPTIDYPFHIILHHLKIFEPNLEDLIKRENFNQLSEGVYVGQNVKIASTAVLNAKDGPIVLEDDVTVMDFAYLSGPLLVGRNSRVIERSSIKEDTRIGETCKIGGEVEAAIIEPYSNKQHHGFLGHSYVGSWVNLGAGTSNSDLKNTYGTIRVQVGGERLESGMQFFGCIIGDYSKSAINTSIFTGKIIGVSSMLYGFVSTNVPSFCNYARSFGQITEVGPETAIETQRRMFARRSVEHTSEDAELLRIVYRLTRDDRSLATEPLSL